MNIAEMDFPFPAAHAGNVFGQFDCHMKKMEKKREKAGLPPQKITNQAHQSVKNINKVTKGQSNTDAEARAKKVEEAYQKAAGAKTDSITAKANMVRDYNERNNKK